MYRLKKVLRNEFSVALGSVGALLLVLSASTRPKPSAAELPTSPVQHHYTGVKRCAACHYDEFEVWKKLPHATEAFPKLPTKYQSDPECLKCHVTGHGETTGFESVSSTPMLAGVTCEACHGPGSEHERIAKQFADKKKLTDEEMKLVCESTTRIIQGACIRCHATSGGHQEHPKYDKQ